MSYPAWKHQPSKVAEDEATDFRVHLRIPSSNPFVQRAAESKTGRVARSGSLRRTTPTGLRLLPLPGQKPSEQQPRKSSVGHRKGEPRRHDFPRNRSPWNQALRCPPDRSRCPFNKSQKPEDDGGMPCAWCRVWSQIQDDLGDSQKKNLETHLIVLRISRKQSRTINHQSLQPCRRVVVQTPPRPRRVPPRNADVPSGDSVTCGTARRVGGWNRRFRCTGNGRFLRCLFGSLRHAGCPLESDFVSVFIVPP